jgi:hypothetical protein
MGHGVVVVLDGAVVENFGDFNSAPGHACENRQHPRKKVSIHLSVQPSIHE